jgi:hypothetical protein
MKKLLAIVGLMLFVTSHPAEAYHRCNPVYTWKWTPHGYVYQYMGCGYYNSEHRSPYYQPYRYDYRYPGYNRYYDPYYQFRFNFNVR